MIRNVLTIAGSDPSGGAGLQADLRTFAALGVHGCAVPAALTAQSTRAVRGVLAVPSSFVRRQLEVLLEDVTVHAVKVGMLASAANVRVVASVLAPLGVPLVLDPVLRATTGRALAAPATVRALRDVLLPLATVVTPNAAEAGALLGRDAPASVDESRFAARALVALGARAALVTGGHVAAHARSCVDVLAERADGGPCLCELAIPRLAVPATRGTGCTLSSAIAARLALGDSLREACAAAQRFTRAAIAAHGMLAVGTGARPVHQLHARVPRVSRRGSP